MNTELTELQEQIEAAEANLKFDFPVAIGTSGTATTEDGTPYVDFYLGKLIDDLSAFDANWFIEGIKSLINDKASALEKCTITRVPACVYCTWLEPKQAYLVTVQLAIAARTGRE